MKTRQEYELIFEQDAAIGDRMALSAYLNDDTYKLKRIEFFLGLHTLLDAVENGEDDDLLVTLLKEVHQITEMSDDEILAYARRQDHQLNKDLLSR